MTQVKIYTAKLTERKKKTMSKIERFLLFKMMTRKMAPVIHHLHKISWNSLVVQRLSKYRNQVRYRV